MRCSSSTRRVAVYDESQRQLQAQLREACSQIKKLSALLLSSNEREEALKREFKELEDLVAQERQAHSLREESLLLEIQELKRMQTRASRAKSIVQTFSSGEQSSPVMLFTGIVGSPSNSPTATTGSTSPANQNESSSILESGTSVTVCSDEEIASLKRKLIEKTEQLEKLKAKNRHLLQNKSYTAALQQRKSIPCSHCNQSFDTMEGFFTHIEEVCSLLRQKEKQVFLLERALLKKASVPDLPFDEKTDMSSDASNNVRAKAEFFDKFLGNKAPPKRNTTDENVSPDLFQPRRHRFISISKSATPPLSVHQINIPHEPSTTVKKDIVITKNEIRSKEEIMQKNREPLTSESDDSEDSSEQSSSSSSGDDTN